MCKDWKNLGHDKSLFTHLGVKSGSEYSKVTCFACLQLVKSTLWMAGILTCVARIGDLYWKWSVSQNVAEMIKDGHLSAQEGWITDNLEA